MLLIFWAPPKKDSCSFTFILTVFVHVVEMAAILQYDSFLCQNFLYTSKEDHSLLKAIDFGLSDFVKPGLFSLHTLICSYLPIYISFHPYSLLVL